MSFSSRDPGTARHRLTPLHMVIGKRFDALSGAARFANMPVWAQTHACSDFLCKCADFAGPARWVAARLTPLSRAHALTNTVEKRCVASALVRFLVNMPVQGSPAEHQSAQFCACAQLKRPSQTAQLASHQCMMPYQSEY